MKTLASAGAITRRGVIRGLGLLVLYSTQRGFSSGTQVFPSPQKLAFELNWFAFIVNFIPVIKSVETYFPLFSYIVQIYSLVW